MAKADASAADRRDTPLRHGRRLVSAAIESIALIEAALLRYETTGTLDKDQLALALERGDHQQENLLKSGTENAPKLLASLARAGNGCQLHAAVLALDPAVITLSAEDGSGPLDALLADEGDMTAECSRRLRDKLTTAASALSVALSRLELQARFVEAILDEDRGEGTPVLLDDLDAERARAAAIAVGALLFTQPRAISTGNRRALDILFADMTSGGAAT